MSDPEEPTASAPRLVDALELPDAPYDADVRAKGLDFRIEYERLDESDTWALAAPEIRPWLLMLWYTAWHQTPCGSHSGNEHAIAARIGMPWAMWQHHREVLLRGWYWAKDGRMYHRILETLVDKHVLSLRINAAERMRRLRQKNHGVVENVTRDSRERSPNFAEKTGPSPSPSPVKATAKAKPSPAGPESPAEDKGPKRPPRGLVI